MHTHAYICNTCISVFSDVGLSDITSMQFCIEKFKMYVYVYHEILNAHASHLRLSVQNVVMESTLCTVSSTIYSAVN